jgi:CRISPR-associated exonuclease Cas4
MYAEDDLLPLSGIQHFAFCPRQWALIHVECQWKENARTAEGRFLHERADAPELTDKRGDRVTMRSVPLVSLSLGLRGVADVVEYFASEEGGKGVCLPKRKGLWMPHPVEYKVGKPKPDERDIVQLCAQAICLEEMHGLSIPSGEMYYGKTRHRLDVAFDEPLRAKVETLCRRMHEVYEAGATPPPLARNCRLCSLMDVCVPELSEGGPVASYYAGYTRDIRNETRGEAD